MTVIIEIIILICIIFASASYYMAEPAYNEYVQNTTAIVESVDDYESYTSEYTYCTDIYNVNYAYESCEVNMVTFDDKDTEESVIVYDDPYPIIEDAINRRDSSLIIAVNHDFNLNWCDIYCMNYGSFWLSDFISYKAYEKNDRLMKEFHFFYYDLTTEEIKNMKREIDGVVYSITSKVPDGSTESEICKISLEELCRICSYDHTLEAPHTHDMYAALVLKSAVCTGYASAYTHILRQFGIESQIISSGTHAYNRLNGGADSRGLFVDTTWADLDRIDASGNIIISYYYFGMTYDQITSIKSHEFVYSSFNYDNEVYTLPYYSAVFEEFDYDTVISSLREQYYMGITMPTIAFSNSEAYEECYNEMLAGDWVSDIDEDYYGYYEYFYNSEVYTWGFVLSSTSEAA